MSTQPKALRLADELDAAQLIAETAKELRRLHAELQRCKQVCDATAEGWRTDAEEWKVERDALAKQKCPCGDRPVEQCLGEWEPGCDMGSNPKYATVAEPAPQQEVKEPHTG